LLQSDTSPEGPNWSYQQICAAFSVSEVTVTHVRKAYCQGGVKATVYRKSRVANILAVWTGRPKPASSPWLV